MNSAEVVHAGLWFVLVALTARAQSAATPTWSHDVAPILYRHCVECHQPDHVGPFSLLAYEDAAKRARFLVKTVRARVMPPWLPDGPVNAFVDERRLTPAEIDVLTRWAAGGAPRGEVAVKLPEIDRGVGEWKLGPPDLVIQMPRSFSIPAGPGDTYQVFPITYDVAKLPAETVAKARIPDSDVLAVAAVDIRPGNAASFHHADVWVDVSGVARRREESEGATGYASFGTPGFPPAVALGGRVPGVTPRFLPDGIASSVLPLRGDAVLHIHYRATGRPETDRSEVGIYFMREPTKRIVNSLLLRSFKLDIPAGATDFVVKDALEIPADCVLMNILPHMHLIAREVHVSATLPDGQTIPLLDISRWNFKWQDRYVYREPILLPKGSRVHGRWIFDNSPANESNPFDPPQRVRFGPNATDEMCAVQLGVVAVNLEEDALFNSAREQKIREKIAELSPDDRARLNWSEAAIAVGETR
jgi:hypothetical protein